MVLTQFPLSFLTIDPDEYVQIFGVSITTFIWPLIEVKLFIRLNFVTFGKDSTRLTAASSELASVSLSTLFLISEIMLAVSNNSVRNYAICH